MLKVTTKSIKLTCHDAAQLLLGKCNLSQRSYKNLKKILKDQKVELPDMMTLWVI